MAMAQGTRLRLGLCSFKHPFLWNISPSIASTTTTTAGAIQTSLCLPWLFRLLHSNALNPLPQRSPAFHGVRYMQRQLPFQRLFCSEATGDKQKMKKKPVANEDSVTIRINKKLPSEIPIFSDCCIFKVPKELRSVNEEAYEPQLIAIGPYHHGKHHLLAMENHKMRYLQSLLQRSDQKDVSRYVQTIRNLEERARKCYAEPLSFTRDEFVEMMLIDGCFLVELVCKIIADNRILFEDPIFGFDHMLIRLGLDLLLVENQIPFFILWELLVTSNVIPNPQVRFIEVMMEVCTYKGFLPRPARAYNSTETTKIKHLLGLVHGNYQPSPERIEVYEQMRTEKGSITRRATELKEAGIKFKSIETHNLFAVSFENGVIEIPKIEIRDVTECVLRNLVAYEQLPLGSPKYFSEYIGLMNSLIDSAKDVELLCRKGIIDNWTGDDETIAILFNKLGKHVFYERALYADIVYNVDKHCKKRSNLWMAKLRRDYFQCPWSIISVLAAIMLLLLTLTQTVYSVLSHYK